MPGYAQPDLQWNSAMSATDMYPGVPKKKRRRRRRKNKIKGIVVPPKTANIIANNK